MNKHTPGPWRRAKYKVFSADEALVAHTRSTGLASDADEANARLIAAAPDLLHALTFVLKGMDAGHIKCAPYIDFDPNAAQLEFKSPAQMLREVLAKATGEGA